MKNYTKKKDYQGCHFTWKPGKTLNNPEFDNLGKKPGKTWNLRSFE